MNFTIELTASAPLLEAIKNLTAAFTGQNLAPSFEATEKPVKTIKATKAIEPLKVVVSELPTVIETGVPPVEKVEVIVVKDAVARVITVEELRTVVREKAQAGKREELKALLTEFSATNVTTLKEEQYADFMAKLEVA